MRRVVGAVLLAHVLCTTGCIDTGQDRVAIPLRVSGSALEGPVLGSGDWEIQITRADLAFGPLYLCAGFQAGSNCDTARLEWTESALVNVLIPEAREVGSVRGVTGFVHSWMYDLGITSLLTQQKPVQTSAAQQLGGNSLILTGSARKGEAEFSFRFESPIQQDEASDKGASVVRKSGSDRFQHEITGAETALHVRFDARPWIASVDFDALAQQGTSELRLDAESQGYRAIKAAVVAGERPAFEWEHGP